MSYAGDAYGTNPYGSDSEPTTPPTPPYVGSRPWAPATPDDTDATLTPVDVLDGLGTPGNQAEKWLPKPNEIEFTAFVAGSSTVTTGGRTIELDPLALEADVTGAAYVTGDLAVAAIQTLSAEQVKTAILLDAAEDRIAAEHIKVAGAQEPARQESQAHNKAALLFDPAQDQLSAEHIKTAISNAYPARIGQGHAKLAVVGGEVGKGSNSQSHMKVASIADFTEPEISQSHIKIAAPTLAAEIQNSSEHLKIAELNAVAEIQNSQDHVKIAERDKANQQIGSEQIKVAVTIDGYPVSVSAESLIVAQSGVDKRENVQEHLKALVATDPVETNVHDHLKVATETAPTPKVDAAHVKVFAFIPSHEVMSAAHVKAAIPFVARRKAGWGLIL